MGLLADTPVGPQGLLPAAGAKPICRAMKRLFQLLLALAVLMAPLTMVGGGAAMAMPHDTMAAMDHCAGMDGPSKKQPGLDIDCMIMCAAVPTVEPRLDPQMTVPAPLLHFPATSTSDGLDPESETPPPRIS